LHETFFEREPSRVSSLDTGGVLWITRGAYRLSPQSCQRRKTSQLLWIALVFAMLFSLSLTVWQGYRQEQTGKQWMTMLQEMVFQTYFLTLLADKPEISQLAQQRLGQVLQTLRGEQQVSMVQFFSHNGLPATFIGDALQGSTGLVGADLQEIELPQILLEQANLSRVNFREANLKCWQQANYRRAKAGWNALRDARRADQLPLYFKAGRGQRVFEKTAWLILIIQHNGSLAAQASRNGA
jgi:Pentapeptide repeats (8 copies)